MDISFKDIVNKQKIQESVIDIEKKQMNPGLFSGDKLKPSVKKQIMNAVYLTLSKNDVDKSRLKYVLVEGSNLTYFYNNYSDIDTHIVISNPTEDEQNRINNYISYEYNVKHEFINGTKNNIELYLMEESEVKKNLNPRYDLINDKWIKKSERIKIPTEIYTAVVEVAMTFARDIDLALGELKRDIIEYEVLDREIEETLIINSKDFLSNKQKKKNEIIADLEALVLKEKNIKDMRKKAYDADFEPEKESLFYVKAEDRSYTTNNLIFKILQKYNYIEPLKRLKYDCWDAAITKKDIQTNFANYLKQMKQVVVDINNTDIAD